MNLFKRKKAEENDVISSPAENTEYRRDPKKAIGPEEISNATVILNKYKSEKLHLEKKIVENEEWWKLKCWEKADKKDDLGIKNGSAWLWNCIVSKHADTMDAYPEANILPRMPDDEEEATRLKEVIPVVLEQNDFQKVYSDIQWYKLKQGTGVYGIFWDAKKLNGLGDITITRVDLLNLFWKGGITDIQDSPNLFYVRLVENEALERQYPELKGKLKSKNINIKEYKYDDTVDTSNMSAVVDWYYHKYNGTKKVLHYCKYVGNTVLFATENEPENYPNGWYDHGMYPFVFDPLFSIEGTPCGYGFIDIGKDTQRQIDVLNNAIITNAAITAKPRYFIRGDGSVNEEEFADWSKDFVHTNGNLGQDSILPIQTTGLSSAVLEVLQSKIEELKETTSNRDVANGGTTAGVTAASGIAAMQEASGKVSRDINMASYNAFRKVILMAIELLRQFYELPRWFRIVGETGETEYTKYTNKALKPQSQGEAFGIDEGMRLPLFDIEASAQKATPYSKMAQNELALQFTQAGFFIPGNARTALATLEMMDFNHKEDVIEIIKGNDALMQSYNTLLQLAIGMAQRYDPMLLPQIAPMAQAAGMEMPGKINTEITNINSNGTLGGEATHMQKARAEAQAAAQV